MRAFHNVCRHRGNKLVWNEDPRQAVGGTCRQFTCKYQGWRYGLDGALNFVQQGDHAPFGAGIVVEQRPPVVDPGRHFGRR